MLPEHSMELSKHNRNNIEIEKKEQQEFNVIASSLSEAFNKNKEISIQLNELENGRFGNEC